MDYVQWYIIADVRDHILPTTLEKSIDETWWLCSCLKKILTEINIHQYVCFRWLLKKLLYVVRKLAACLLFVIWQPLRDAVNIAWGFFKCENSLSWWNSVKWVWLHKTKLTNVKSTVPGSAEPVRVGKKKGDLWHEQESRPTYTGY